MLEHIKIFCSITRHALTSCVDNYFDDPTKLLHAYLLRNIYFLIEAQYKNRYKLIKFKLDDHLSLSLSTLKLIDINFIIKGLKRLILFLTSTRELNRENVT